MKAEARIFLLSTSLVAALALPVAAAPATGTKKTGKTGSSQSARSSSRSKSSGSSGSRSSSGSAARKTTAKPAPVPAAIPVEPAPLPPPPVAESTGPRKFLNRLNPFKRGAAPGPEAAPATGRPVAGNAAPPQATSASPVPMEVAKESEGTGRKLLNKLTPWRRESAEAQPVPPVAAVPPMAAVPRASRSGTSGVAPVPPVPAAAAPAPEVVEGRAAKLLDRINPMKLLKGGDAGGNGNEVVPQPELAGRAAGEAVPPGLTGDSGAARKESYFGNLFSGLGGKREPAAVEGTPGGEAPSRGGFWSNPLAALKRLRSDDLPPEVEPEKIPRPKDWTERKVIVEHGTPLYEFGPSQSQGPDMKLVRGTVVKEKKRERGWVLVEVSGGRRGYIAATAMRDALKTDFLEPPKSSSAPKTMMASSGTNPKSWAPGAPPPDLPDEAPMMDLDGALDLLPALQGSKDGKPATVTKPSANPPVPVDLPPAPDPEPLPADDPVEKTAPETPAETPAVPLPPQAEPETPASPGAPVVPLPPALPELPALPETPAEPTPAAEPATGSP